MVRPVRVSLHPHARHMDLSQSHQQLEAITYVLTCSQFHHCLGCCALRMSQTKPFSNLNLSWLLHIHDLMLSVYNCRSGVRFQKSFGGAKFRCWVSSAKGWWLTKWLALMSESGVACKTNSTGPSEPCGTPNMKGEGEEAELLTTMDWFLSYLYIWSTGLHAK